MISGKKTPPIPWQPFLIGALAFFLNTGGAIIWPGNLGWMLASDPAMNQIGWMFFRNGPIFQQPFGANWQFGMELSSSTVYCDSVSILAFPLKFIKGWLPEQFQYFGVWIFLCYLLQAFFSWKLLGRLTQEKDGLWRRTAAVAFFVIAPVFVWRIHWHLALGSHWLILAAFYLYFSPGLRARSWILLLIVTTLVTPIILMINLIVFGAAIVRRYFDHEIGLATASKTIAITCTILLLVMWEAGYFMVSDVGSTGFGKYRTSLLGFIDPGVGDLKGKSSWSRLFPDQPQSEGNYEGFCFLGSGMILLSGVSLVGLFRSGLKSLNWKKLWPIFLIFIGSILFALSNKIAVGPSILFQYDLPFILDRAISPFRSSGRFIWLAYYLLMAGVLAFVLKRMGRVPGFILLGGCLIIQIADSWKALITERNAFAYDYQPRPLNSSFWQTAAGKYQKISYTPPDYALTNYVQLCYFAASNHLPISLCRYGRTDEQKLATTRLQALAKIDNKGFDPQAFYVFENPAIWARELAHLRPGDWAGIVDHYPIVAPNWSLGPDPDIRALIKQALPEYHFGTELQFGPNGQGLVYLANGWSSPEEWGVWSQGAESLLILRLLEESPSDLLLKVEGFGFIHPKSRRQTIEVWINSAAVGDFVYSAAEREGPRSIRIPREVLAGRNGLLEIKFRYHDADSPARLGKFLDPRIIALGLRSLSLVRE